MKISCTVNKRKVTLDVDPRRTLLAVLREDLHLTGTKEGCGEGECGACTVIINGEAVDSCLTPVGQVDGCSILTIEGLEQGGKLHPLQEAFISEGAVQCGFCIPGMIMSGKALLDKNKNPDETAIRTALAGNLCRCTGYTKIIESISAAADMVKGGK